VHVTLLLNGSSHPVYCCGICAIHSCVSTCKCFATLVHTHTYIRCDTSRNLAELKHTACTCTCTFNHLQLERAAAAAAAAHISSSSSGLSSSSSSADPKCLLLRSNALHVPPLPPDFGRIRTSFPTVFPTVGGGSRPSEWRPKQVHVTPHNGSFLAINRVITVTVVALLLP
jgi:hypothetical protein